jgi:hypothetical protein
MAYFYSNAATKWADTSGTAWSVGSFAVSFFSTSAAKWEDTSDVEWEAGSVLIWPNFLQSQHSLSAAVAASFGVSANPLQAAEQLRGDVAVDFLVSANALRTAEQLFGNIGGTIFYQNYVWGVSSVEYTKVLGIDKINISRIM